MRLNAKIPCLVSSALSLAALGPTTTTTTILPQCDAFSPVGAPHRSGRPAAPFVTLRSTAAPSGGDRVVAEDDDANGALGVGLDEAEEIEFLLVEHKPLGCTAEECLAVEEDGAKHVFISKVVEGGNAEKAGIMVGDVIVGVTGTFEDLVSVAGLGIEKVQAFIAGRSPDEVLSILVARGSDVMARHESALVDLCTLPEKDINLENCLTSLNGYDMGFEEDAPTVDCTDNDTECMIDQLYSGWGEDLGLEEEMNEAAEKDDEPKKKKPAPWSSRSSPSGTFVRDPKTGKMVNIDA